MNGRERPVATTPARVAGYTAIGAGRDPGYGALGDALAARDAEIVTECQQRYFETLGAADTEHPLWRVVSLGTQSIVRWLQTGEAANRSDRKTIAAVGQEAAHQREVVAREFSDVLEHARTRSATVDPTPGVVDDHGAPAVAPPADRSTTRWERPPRDIELSVEILTKLNFWWSDITCDVLTEEAARLGVHDTILRAAIAMVVKSSQVSLIDMTKRFDAELESLHRRLTELALHDPLTGLPNRALLIDQLDRSLARLARQQTGLALVFIDVDDFKAVNDVYGHACGDAVLTEIAARLTANVRPGDLVARFGGDEFVLLFEGLSNPAVEGQRRAEHLRAATAAPMTVAGSDIRVTVSAGVATVRQPGMRSEDVIAQADAVMYTAKRAGRNRVAVAEIGETPRGARFATTSDLHHALERRQLRLVYQPVYDSRNGTVVGFEALLRWDHPERGTVPPLEFIPIAEDSGLMVAIGEWVLEEACRQAMEWAPIMGAVPRMAVNVSARQLDDRYFVRRLVRILEETGMPAGSLMLEITETVLLGEDIGHEATLSVLKNLGVLLAIDDFGTGYSSLAYLRRFPVDQLKVDRSFVKDVAEHGDTRIMQAVVRLAHELGLEVVAEGVETSAELTVVQGLGCDIVQGFLLGRPVAPAAIELERRAAPVST